MKLLIILTFAAFNLFAEYNETQCQGLIDQIHEVHDKQMSLKELADGDSESESRNTTLKELLSLRKLLHDNGYVPAIEDEANIPEGTTIEEMRAQLDSLDEAIYTVMSRAEFQQMSRLNKYLSSVFISSCQDSSVTSTIGETTIDFEDVNCFANGYRFTRLENVKEFGEDVMNVIVQYMTQVEQEENFPISRIIQDCRALRGVGSELSACDEILANVSSNQDSTGGGADRVVADNGSGRGTGSNNNPSNTGARSSAQVTCGEGQERSGNTCRDICSNLEIRSSSSGMCVPDEAAQRAANINRQESKKKWGKILRTSATVALIGGGALLGAWAIKSLFFNDNNGSYNNGYQAGLAAGGSSRQYYYPTMQGGAAGYSPYVIPSQYSNGMGVNGMPAWSGFNPYMNASYPQYQSVSDFSNYSFSF
tara:strand:+ start:83152 stop:84417 length:1266 start_codon:yes stop_codon:yes gene_type:complete